MSVHTSLERGQAIYDTKFRERLEREKPGHYAIIILNTEECFVGHNNKEAWERYKEIHHVLPPGGLHVVGIVIKSREIPIATIVASLEECAWYRQMRKPGKIPRTLLTAHRHVRSQK